MGIVRQQNARGGRLRKRALALVLAICAIAIACGAVFACGGSNSSEGANGGAAASSPSVQLADGAAETSDDAASDEVVDGEEASDAAAPSEPARTPEGEVVPEEAIPHIDAEYKEDIVLVMLAPGYSPDELTAAIDASGCTMPQVITEEDVAAGFVTLTVAEGYDVAHAMTQLEMLPELDSAQPDFVYHLQDDGFAESGGADALKMRLGGLGLTASPAAGAALLAQATSVNDPYADQQWALSSIQAYDAWDLSRANGDVTVAIIDNGCLVNHEDLAANIVGTYNAATSTATTVDTDVAPFDNHGTHVAGIVSAVANNGKGVAGVSYNAKLLPIQAFTTATTAYSSAIVRAYNYIMSNAAALNIKVINMSIGVKVNGTSTDGVSLDASDKALIKSVNDAYEAGILTTCSSGNEGSSGAYLNYPSDWIDNALAVISLQQGSSAGSPPTKASNSNYNMVGQTTKDLSAPGASIYSTVTASSSSYAYKSGTSMAAPCVAGVAALVFAANPDLTAAQVSDLLCNTATDLGDAGWDNQYGAGEVNALAAVKSIGLSLSGNNELLVGGTTQLTPSRAGAWSWESSNPSVATVSSDGLVTGVSSGKVSITARLDGAVARKTVFVYEAVFLGESQMEYGSYLEISFLASPGGGTWDFVSSDSAIACIDRASDGDLKGVYGLKVGEAVVTASRTSNPAIAFQHPVKVVPRQLGSSSVKITWPGTMSYAYTGNPIEPKPSSVEFTDAAGQTRVLEEGTDYALSYAGNVEPGEAATVTVTGKGNFAGTEEKTFRIAPKSLEGAVIAGVEDAVYTGADITFPITVTLDGKALSEREDFTVSYADNRDAGTATVSVEGAGAYAGSVSKTFAIRKAPVAIPKAESGLVYAGSEQVGVRAGAGYKLSGTVAATDAGAYKATATLNDAANFEWADGTSSPRTITWSIAPKAVEPAIALSQSTFDYDGTVHRPSVSIAASGRTLASADYEVVWPSGCTDAGTYKISVSCKGNYTGAAVAAFTIKRASLASAAVSGVPDYRYRTGTAIEPDVQVTLGKASLEAGSDYSVSYSSNKKAGTAKITVRGMGNYAGELNRTFQIINRPVYAGANRMPVSSTATWTLKHCAFKVLSGAGAVEVSGSVVKAKKAGKAVLGIYNDAGKRVAKKTVRVYKLSGKTRTIALAADRGYAVDVRGASKANKANIWLYRTNGTKAQNFRFSLLKDGTYTLKNPNSGLLVTVAGRSKASGANIYQYTAKKTAYQRWRISVDAKNRLTFVNKASRLALDLKSGRIEDMRNICQRRLTGAASQKWVLV